MAGFQLNSLYEIREIALQRHFRCSLPAQPTSRGLSGSLATLAKSSKRSPELRDQLAVLHSDVTTERALQRKKAASLPVYLYWAFSGVTLAEVQMVATIRLAS